MLRVPNLACRMLVALVVVAATLASFSVVAAAQDFTPWSAPTPLGPVVNTATTDGCPAIAKSDLTLFLASSRPGGYGGMDIYVAQRDSVSDAWGPPVNAGPAINSVANEICPTLAINGHHLYFVSDRLGGCGGQDLYVAWRRDKRNDFEWEEPENLGCTVNSSFNDFTPSLFEDEHSHEIVLYFSSNRPGGAGGADIYSSTLDASGEFGPATIDMSLSTSADDQRPNVRKDGLEIFFDSTRPGSLNGVSDLWTSTRASASDAWSPPVSVSELNTTAVEGRPYLSFDGLTLYFMSARPGGSGGLDVWSATRTKHPDR
jgi:hypothetical protein